MRWIFISLAFINLCVFAWGLVVTSAEQAPVSQLPERIPFVSVPKIVLLSEIPASDLQRNAEAAQAVALSAAETTIKPLCEMVGAFVDRETADNFVERLRAIDVSSWVQELELPSGPGYWVYLPPQINRREALRLLAELHAKSIDSYVIPKGDVENGISLGMFSQKNLAEARMAEMQALGLTPLLDEIERTYRETWVILGAGEAEKMSNLSWQRVMEGINMLERRQNYCLDVAS